MKNLFQFLIIIPVILFCFLELGIWNLPVAHAASGLNRVINFQGRVVKKADGTNVSDGTYSFTFKLYDAASSGNLLWQETQSSVQVTSGIFQVSLGSVTGFNSGGFNVNFNQSNLYLDITFNSETFGSRIQLAAVPQAINSEQLDSVIATPSANGFNLQGGLSTQSTVHFNTSGTTLTINPANAGALTIQSNGANGLTLDTGAASTITEGATATTLNIGTSNTATTLTLGSGTGGDTIQIGHGTVANGNTQTIQIGDSATGTGDDLITIGNTNGASSIVLNVGTGGLALNLGSDATGDLYFRNSGGTLSRLAVGSGSQCLLGGTTPGWGSCSGGSSPFTTFSNNSNTIIDPSPLTDALSIGNAGTGNYLPYAGLYIEPPFNTKGNALVAINQTGLGDILTASASGATEFVINNNGNVGIGSTAPVDKLNVAGGNIVIGAQANNSSAIATLNSAAGTFGSQTSVLAATSSAVFNGKLFVATNKLNGAGVYRYDGGTTWTLVTHAAGQAVSGDTANISGYVLAVYNGALYIGSQTARGVGTGALYESTDIDHTTDDFTLVNTTRGTFNSTAGMDAVSDIEIWNGNLYVATAKTASAAIYRYNGGTGAAVFTAINNAVGKMSSLDTANANAFLLQAYDGNLIGASQTGVSNAARVDIYTGNGTTWAEMNSTAGTFGADTALSNVTSLAVYNGSLFIGLSKNGANNGAVYMWTESTTNVAGTTTFIRTNNALGQMNSGDSATTVTDIPVLKNYNGRLYAGARTTGGTGALYQYTPGVAAATAWSLVNTTRGTFGSDTSVLGADTMVEMNGTLYIGTEKANAGSVYTWTYTQNNSYSLKFDSGSGNYGEISFVGNTQADDHTGHTGTFIFSNAIAMGTGAFDYAEDYPTTDNSLVAGDIVAIDPNNSQYVLKSGIGIGLVGVVSSSPGFELGPTAQQAEDAKYIPVALNGRVPVNVSTENGSIKAGDYLTASSTTPGIAVKAVSAGPVIGRAMEDYAGTGSGQITVFVDISYFDGAHDAPTGLSANTAAIAGIGVDPFASLSAVLGAATQSANFSLDSLQVNGLATISADLRVKGNGLIEGILNVIDTIQTHNFLVTGASDFFGNTIFHNHVSFASDNTGSANIKQGATSVTITFTSPYDVSPHVTANIALTQQTNPDGSVVSQDGLVQNILSQRYTYILTNISTQGFTIVLNKKAANDIPFNWTAVGAAQ